MRALRRIATPASVGLAMGACVGCSLPVDDFQAPSSGAGGPLVGNTDAQVADAQVAAEAGTSDAASDSSSVVTTTDASPDACVCLAYNPGGKCKEWNAPGCAK